MTIKARLLIVDDEPDLRAELKPLLERSGYQVYVASNGAEALNTIQQVSPDLVILDMLMPQMDGREVLRRLRGMDDWTPVILLTQVNNTGDRVMTLQEGADDYLNKPFDALELLARIDSILRRVRRNSPSLAAARRLVSRNLVLDRQKRQITLDGSPIPLTARAFDLLAHLMGNPGSIISRDRLLDEVWGWSYSVTTRAVDIRIAEIRKALDEDAAAPRFIETVVGHGYRFTGEVQTG